MEKEEKQVGRSSTLCEWEHKIHTPTIIRNRNKHTREWPRSQRRTRKLEIYCGNADANEEGWNNKSNASDRMWVMLKETNG